MRPDMMMFPHWIKATLGLALLILLGGGTWFYQSQEQTIRHRAEENLSAIARLKVNQIAAWRSARLRDAAALSESPFFREGVVRFLADPDDENIRELRATFQSIQAHYYYADILLVDPAGRALLSLDGSMEEHGGYAEALAAALRECKPVFTGLHTEEEHPKPHLSVVAPLFADAGHAKKPLGAVIMVSDASQFLYPLVESWPTPSKSAETLLFRREGDDVLFLNDLRHQPETALKLRIPLTRTDVPTVMAVLGRGGLVEGKDYRGVDVVAVILPIPDSPWFMEAKVDAAEVFADWRFRSLLILAILVGSTALLGTVGLLLRQREKKAHYRALYLAEAALRADVERHSITLKSIGDAVIGTDARGIVELLNPVAEALTGWTDAEARGKPLDKVFCIINEQTGERIEDPVAKVLQERAVVGLANHTVLIARDGTRRPIADSGAPIYGRKNEITGVVLVFRDQTGERRAIRRTEIRSALIEYAATHTLGELMTRALDEIGALVDSPIGFYHFVEADQKTLSLQQWSTRTLTEFCRAERKGLHYPIEQAGVWADCARQKKPIMHNDYASLKHRQGMPDGHAEIIRDLVVPVMREGRLVAILGVGNKPVDYTEKDAETVAFLADVTWHLVEQKRAEEVLIESERKWRSILINMPQIGISLDIQGRIVFANKHFLHLTGWAEEEVLGRDWFELCIPVEIRDEIRKTFRTAMNSEESVLGLSTYENDIVTRDGERLNVVWSNVLTGDVHGAILDVTCLGVDVTERRRAELQRERMLAAIEQVGEMIVITNPEGAIQYVNPAFERTTGYHREEAIGQNSRILKSGQQDHAFYRNLWETISGGGIFQGRLVNKRKDGTFYTEEATIAPVRDVSGRIINYVAVKRDITENLRLAAQFHQAQKMESVGRLAGGVAHDFNNMLGIIIGNAELALSETDPDEPIHQNLHEILKASQRSADTVRQLLAFARKQTVSPRMLDLNETVSGMFKMLKRLIGEDIHFAWMPGRSIWPVKIDPSQIDQILANLAVNARDAIAGVGKITIETGNVVFDEAYCSEHKGFVPGEFVLLAVSDDGMGMSKEILGHIFEPFFTTKGVGKGTGLGLATIYGIVKQNEGFINVYSEPGKGTTFKIYLPRFVETGFVKAPEATGEEETLGGTETVLVVEDEAGILYTAQRMLEALEYKVLTARTATEAMRQSEEHGGNIHLLITDVVMPEMNGKELASRLTSMRPGMKVLFMSGYTANVIAHHGVLDEGVLFIHKPFSLRDLAKKVRQALDRR